MGSRSGNKSSWVGDRTERQPWFKAQVARRQSAKKRQKAAKRANRGR